MQTSIFSSPKWLAVLLTIYGLEYIVALFLSAPPEQNTAPTEPPRRLTLIPREPTSAQTRRSEPNWISPEAPFPPWALPEDLAPRAYTWEPKPTPAPSLEPGRQFLPANASVDGFSDLLTQRPDLPELDAAPKRVFREAPTVVLRNQLNGWRLNSEFPPLNKPGLPHAAAPTTAEIILDGPGRPLSVTQIDSCGVPELDQYAIHTLQNSQFAAPKSADESPTADWVIGRVDILWGP